jgi:type IV pilus assembly protein PilO
MAGSAISDFAKKPPKEKAMIFVIITAALGLLYWQFLHKPAKKATAAAYEEQQAEETRKDKLRRDRIARDELAKRSAELRRENEKNQRALPTSAELPAFFETLGRKVSEAGVEVKKWTNKKEIPGTSFVQVPLDIELTGTFMQLKRFFSSIDPRSQARGQVGDEDRLITIEDFTLKEPKVKNAEIVLTASFTASTFRQDAPAAAAAAAASAAPAAAPAAPGAATGSGSGSGSAAGSGSGSGSAKGSGAGPVGLGAAITGTGTVNPLPKVTSDVNAAMSADAQRIKEAAEKAAAQAEGRMGG